MLILLRSRSRFCEGFFRTPLSAATTGIRPGMKPNNQRTPQPNNQRTPPTPMNPTQAADLSRVIETTVKAIEATEIERRV
jgi:hypothetical protein